MVSEFFIPIYESNFEKFEDAKSISPIQKQANLIFCEREFISWLRNKFGNKLTNKTYPNYCTQKHFKLFIPDFVILKKKKEYILKKKAILQRLIAASKFPPIENHEYDIDIVGTYITLKKLLETHPINEDKKTTYLNLFFDPIQNYCLENEMSLELVLQLNYPIVINNTSINFEAFLGRTLMVCDMNRIASILNRQNTYWKRKDKFVTFVEHPVYKYVFHNGLFDNKDRLAKITDWFEKKKDLEEAQKINLALNKKNKTQTLKAISPSFLLKGLQSDKKYFINNANNFADFMKELKKEFISSDTKLDNLKNILSEKTIKLENRVDWTGTFIDLNIFVTLLEGKTKKISSKWETTIKVFVKDGQEISITQLSKCNGIKTSRDKLNTIVALL